MKKILLVLLFVGIGQQLKAQEQFLKFDSIQVIQGQLMVVPPWGWNTDFIAVDSVLLQGNSLVKVKNITFAAESPTFNFDPAQKDNLRIDIFNCKLNGIVVASINGFHNWAVDNFITDKQNIHLKEELDLMESDDLFFEVSAQLFRHINVQSHFVDFFYRIELHHYSYE